MITPERQQLRMLWPTALLESPPATEVPTGYLLRVFQPDLDAPAYLDLMHSAGFTGCDDAFLAKMLDLMLAGGFLVITQPGNREIVASAMAHRGSTPWCQTAGSLGWVAASAAHAGRSLGRAVCGAAVSRLIAAGYRCIYLLTDDWRLPAVKTYLRLGFVPHLCAPDMHERWRDVCEQVRWPFTPADWPNSPNP
jgi:mycothiol synthase